MGAYRLRVQVQQGSRQEIAAVVYNEDRPCSRRQAQSILDDLEHKAASFYSDRDWRDTLSTAIRRSKQWVSGASKMGTGAGSRTVHSEPFDYDRYRFRVDIEINTGDGHFTT